MSLDIYWTSLTILSLCVGFALGYKIFPKILPWPFIRELISQDETDERVKDPKQFLLTFLSVYLLVMASEWLQVGVNATRL